MMQRVLALDIRAAMFGFIVLEDPNTILDFGVSGYRRDLCGAIQLKVERISALFVPTWIVSRYDARASRRASGQTPCDIVREEAEKRSITFRFVSTPELRQHFLQLGLANKHEVARAVAARFPELAWRIPKKRKPWQSEPKTQPLFDAAALAVMHFTQARGSGLISPQ